MMMLAFALGLSLGVIPIPLPCQLLFCILMLWRYPVPEPTTPWEGMEEHQSWWEKDESPPKTKEKDKDELW